MQKLKYNFNIGEKLSEDPLVYIFDDFLSKEDCLHIISIADSGMKKSILGDPKKPKYSDFRTGNTCWVLKDKDEVTNALCRRVADLIAVPVSHAENFQVINYEKNQEYKAHLDAFNIDTELGKRHIKRGGQRLLTALIYLNEVEEGGETVFPKLKLTLKPKTGRLCLFYNCMPDDQMQRNPLSLHGGLPVIQGKKWACNLWFHEHKWK